MNVWELYVIFALGLVSSLHCVSMCGPIVLSYSLPLGAKRFPEQILAHLLYNAGRILTYALLGALAGLAGGTVGFVGQLAGIENVAAIVAGGLMVIAGVIMLDLIPSKRLQKLNPLLYTSRLLRPLSKLFSSTAIGSKFPLGIMLGFLPCGLIYAALLKSLATGTAFAGAVTMMAFGLGTAASLLGIGIFSSAFSIKLSRWGSRFAAVSVLLLGLFMVSRGVMPMMKAPVANEEVPACHR
ncbi:MAG: sulfite exporter TauE/SafE family protein [Acidobacteria bacterium]|nr:sulfite exporter TauE/SafE family protein [Acidobacteriota bacterium]MBK8147735.1 sulfite exporter TauE/SafE family protein [Acidobacteriota bacterium]